MPGLIQNWLLFTSETVFLHGWSRMDPTTLGAMAVTTKVAQLCTTPCLTRTERRLGRNPTNLSAHVWLVYVLILRPRLQVCPRFLVVFAFLIEPLRRCCSPATRARESRADCAAAGRQPARDSAAHASADSLAGLQTWQALIRPGCPLRPAKAQASRWEIT